LVITYINCTYDDEKFPIFKHISFLFHSNLKLSTTTLWSPSFRMVKFYTIVALVVTMGLQLLPSLHLGTILVKCRVRVTSYMGINTQFFGLAHNTKYIGTLLSPYGGLSSSCPYLHNRCMIGLPRVVMPTTSIHDLLGLPF
jgi:hypothetical protein